MEKRLDKMQPKNLRKSIIHILSSNRREDQPEICQALTIRQIRNQILEALPPTQKEKDTEIILKHIDEQVRALVIEFEILPTGSTERSFCMAAPSLIVTKENPLNAKYVGDRMYLNAAITRLKTDFYSDETFYGISEPISRAREILEEIGISLQTEEMLLETVVEPRYPTDLEISVAEKISLKDINSSAEIYVPIRDDFMENRWQRLDRNTPSSQVMLYRAKLKLFMKEELIRVYLWKRNNDFFRLKTDQGLLAMYNIDIEQNLPRLINLDNHISEAEISEMPSDYRRLVRRYTVESENQVTAQSAGENKGWNQRQRRIRPKYRRLIEELLEKKLGVNRPILLISTSSI
jgi:hypothetical protein